VVGGHAGHAGGGDGDAVIALHAADDLLLLRPPAGIVVVPDQLDGGVDGFGAGVGEKHLRHHMTADGFYKGKKILEIHKDEEPVEE